MQFYTICVDKSLESMRWDGDRNGRVGMRPNHRYTHAPPTQRSPA